MNCCWRRPHTLTLLTNEVILSELKLRLTFLLLFHLPHYVVAATHFLVNAPALRDGQGFTVMRPAHLDTMERDACCLAAAPTELTAILSQVPVYVPLASWWVHSLVVRNSVAAIMLLCFIEFFFFFLDIIYFIVVVFFILTFISSHGLMRSKPPFGERCQDASTIVRLQSQHLLTGEE